MKCYTYTETICGGRGINLGALVVSCSRYLMPSPSIVVLSRESSRFKLMLVRGHVLIHISDDSSFNIDGNFIRALVKSHLVALSPGLYVIMML